MRILVGMVVIIIIGGFALGFLGALLNLPLTSGMDPAPAAAPLPTAPLPLCLERRGLGGGPRGARRAPARPDPHPVDQPARPPRARARRRPPPGRASCAPRAWTRRSSSPSPAAAASSPACAATAPAATPSCSSATTTWSRPNAADGWTHDPFAADIADGYVWGRGAVDMKQMVALEVMVVALLARRARAAGLDPARDPIPGLRRDVLFACTADEEAGGRDGAGWLAANRPETLRAAGALNEAGAVCVDLAGRRFYPIQVAEKGFEVFRIHVHGTWGHGSMPRDDNAAVMAAEAVRRLAAPGRAAPHRPDARVPRRHPGGAPAGRGRARGRRRRRRPAAQRGGHPLPVRPDVRPGAARARCATPSAPTSSTPASSTTSSRARR